MLLLAEVVKEMVEAGERKTFARRGMGSKISSAWQAHVFTSLCGFPVGNQSNSCSQSPAGLNCSDGLDSDLTGILRGLASNVRFALEALVIRERTRTNTHAFVSKLMLEPIQQIGHPNSSEKPRRD